MGDQSSTQTTLQLYMAVNSGGVLKKDVPTARATKHNATAQTAHMNLHYVKCLNMTAILSGISMEAPPSENAGSRVMPAAIQEQVL